MTPDVNVLLAASRSNLIGLHVSTVLPASAACTDDACGTLQTQLVQTLDPASRRAGRPVWEDYRSEAGAFGLPADAELIVSISRLVPRKGFDTAIRAAAVQQVLQPGQLQRLSFGNIRKKTPTREPNVKSVP